MGKKKWQAERKPEREEKKPVYSLGVDWTELKMVLLFPLVVA